MANSVTVTPQESGGAVTFVPVTKAPLAGARETEADAEFGAPDYSRILLQRASGQSVDVVLGLASDSVGVRVLWYEDTLEAALTAARADLLSWGRQRCNVEVEGQTYENCILRRPPPNSYHKKQVGAVHGVSFFLIFEAIP